MTTLTSRNGTTEFGPGLPTLLINDQLRVMDQNPQVLAELQEGRLDSLLAMARAGQEAGMDVADILINHPDLDETRVLPQVAVAVHEALGCPISLDSRNPEALAAALAALRPYKALINSAMPIGHLHGMSRTAEGRLAEARVIVEAAQARGIPREDVVVDAICLASSAEPDSMRATLRTVRALRDELGVTTLLGIGNAGFGMPERTYIDLAYLLAAVPHGLDAALVDPATPGLIEGVRAIDFLAGIDPYGKRYIEQYRAKKRTS